MPASANPERTRAAMQAVLEQLRAWRSGNEAANAQHLQDLGNMQDPAARERAIAHVAEGAGPAAPLAGGAAADLIRQQQMAGLLRGQARNTFTGQAQGAGVHVGMTQPKGTPVEKLFSNFADYGMSSPEQQAAFRSAMLDRAVKDPRQFRYQDVATTTQPFNKDLWARIDASAKGDTRVQLYNNLGETQAAARIEKNGMLDSIATDKAASGKGLGADLLRYLDDQRLANIYEVPDRSPGFVGIQKQVIEALRNK